jgi:hypothetical protein
MVSNNVLNDVSKCYYVAEMDENKYQYQITERSFCSSFEISHGIVYLDFKSYIASMYLETTTNITNFVY